MQRYYSGNYNRLSDPSDPFNPTLESATSSTVHLDSYDTAYRPVTPSHTQDAGLQHHAHSYSGEVFQPLADDYEEPKFFPAPISPQKKWYQIQWTRKRKIIGWSLLALLIIIIAVIIGVVVFFKETAFTYTPSNAHVTNAAAFSSGGATKSNPYKSTNDGIGAGADTYKYYTGPSTNFPAANTWVSFSDMWSANLNTLQTSCGTLGAGPDNSAAQIQDIYAAIQDRAQASKVDHRFIFAIILQESNGCPRVGSTTSQSGVTNPGLMQSHDGAAFNAWHARDSIFAMVQDGTQGTSQGAGLVQGLDLLGDPFKAARYYNSGKIPKDGNLSEAAGATACYVTDVANRLTGWVKAKSTCPGDGA